MVLTTIADLRHYTRLLALSEDAVAWLTTVDVSSVADGRHDLGSGAFANVERTAGRGRADAKLETHRRMADLHLCLEGVDVVGWAPQSTLDLWTSPYDDERDVQFHDAAPCVWLDLTPGLVLIVWPEDAHLPLAGPAGVPLRKLVVKVPL